MDLFIRTRLSATFFSDSVVVAFRVSVHGSSDARLSLVLLPFPLSADWDGSEDTGFGLLFESSTEGLFFPASVGGKSPVLSPDSSFAALVVRLEIGPLLPELLVIVFEFWSTLLSCSCAFFSSTAARDETQRFRSFRFPIPNWAEAKK